MRSRFDEQLASLKNELIEIGALCEEAISLASRSLTECDTELAASIAPLDGDIDRKEREAEGICLRLLLQQQPVARDLRQVSAALKMITDMKRIGDQAQNIAEIVQIIDGVRPADSDTMRAMAEATIGMVTMCVDAYVKQDVNLANKVVAADDTVDDCFGKVKSRLIEEIRNDPTCGEYALNLLMIAKYFERIGDHAVNIAGWVTFSVTGEHKEG